MSQAEQGFAYSQDHFRQLIEDVLAEAKRLGASDAGAEVSEGSGMSVSVRRGALENVERNRDKSLGISVYLGQRRGNASTSDFSPQALRDTVRAAYDIARFTAEDEFAGLPDEQDLSLDEAARPSLDLFHPWAITAEQAAELALRCEDAALKTDPRITNSEGAAVSAQQSHFFSGNSRGFRGGYASSRHSVSVAPIAGRGAGMERDAWYSSMRDAAELSSPESIGRYAAERALARLKGRKVRTASVPVLFEAPVAAGLLGALVQATSGGALYRRASFLLDSLDQQVLAPHVEVVEDPHVLKGKGSSPFDDEGVTTKARTVVEAGVLKGYFLSTYSARKLGMRTTGHAGGSHNLTMRSKATAPGDDLPTMLRRLGTGLFVTELMGQGVNYVTGDYSRGASGYWVENGVIAHPVHEITIAGNVKEMFQQIVGIGADTYTLGSKTVGSILIERMKLAGA
ncbi:metalloprotease PmbA [Mitsuaria sp. TWR114]|jgi:PmbA protein|uniref:metalloprotease PmbA n=1 Tax=unclassified Roseateles TaxID=2626991 RepID=UPI0008EDCE34|nr:MULTISPECIES: metalloprotease PmbA [unclassified Roseateles]MBB3280597.1 PmbA protein [Mitsuaria sp. BK037]MBB3292642.1 PmbA protein [Mitsuaria sp. BK041]MBB3361859.1 PmbA protein [Mitsuaria sp. BK045]TXD97339.1 metalloprotease PmbA [Mitsuaria sp. TWR114]SFR76472.1 PmbA protein [Mitsuaria sp. PDC51]